MPTTFATLFSQTRKLHEESRTLRADATITVSESKDAIARARHVLESIGLCYPENHWSCRGEESGANKRFDSRLFAKT
jgi:hypothetical protein